MCTSWRWVRVTGDSKVAWLVQKPTVLYIFSCVSKFVINFYCSKPYITLLYLIDCIVIFLLMLLKDGGPYLYRLLMPLTQSPNSFPELSPIGARLLKERKSIVTSQSADLTYVFVGDVTRVGS